MLEKVKTEIGDLYPLIPDPAYKGKAPDGGTGRRPVTEDLFTTRRNLPHREMGGSTYFITYRCLPGVVLDEPARTFILDNWKYWHGSRYLLHAAVVMPDHVHVLITPRQRTAEPAVPPQWFSLEEILHTNKSYTAHAINKMSDTAGSPVGGGIGGSPVRKGPVWQDERFDRIVRDEDEFIEKWNYMASNPVKAELVNQPEQYKWLHQNPDAWIEDDEGNTAGPAVPPEGVEQAAGLFEKNVEQAAGLSNKRKDDIPPGYLIPVAYLWTRTVKCKNPTCGATVPLVKQTWLCKKKGRYAALRVVAPKGQKQVCFEVVESDIETGLGFDPAGFSKAGNATCPFCGTVADIDYVKAEGRAGRMAAQAMAVVCTRAQARGKVYLATDELHPSLLPNDDAIRARIADLCQRTGLTVPDEPIASLPADCYDNTLGITVRPYGLTTFGHLFTPRQILSLLTFAAVVRDAHQVMTTRQHSATTEHAQAVVSLLAAIVDRIADWNSTLCSWSPENTGGAKIGHTFGRQVITMVWDSAESGLWGEATGSTQMSMNWVLQGIEHAHVCSNLPAVARGSATSVPWADSSVDAVITDPPYYDNVPYADISDFFYVWLKRTIGHLYPEHFSGAGTPKKQEAVADASRHGGDKAKAVRAYEDMMAQALAEAHRVLKPGGTLAVVYAHKTTLGWSTLVEALRKAGFTVTEAWPLDTEMKSRLRGMDSAALASSIFLVGRKRSRRSGVGNYEDDVQPELEQIVRERVATLWDQGITGADLVIAAVGAGLRAFTKYERVEYANGEPVEPKRFLAEVEGVVLDVMLQQIVGRAASPATGRLAAGPTLSAVDPPSRFYVLWRYVYKAAAIDAGEAIVFTYGQHVELDGQKGLSNGRSPLVEKKKSTYRLRDFTERGDDEKLGLPETTGETPVPQAAPLVDSLHRVLWIMENRPRMMTEFLRESRVNRDQLRVLAQALAGPALKGGELGDVSVGSELAALTKLTSNWKSVIEDALSPLERSAS